MQHKFPFLILLLLVAHGITAQTSTFQQNGYSIGQNAMGNAVCNEAYMPDIHRIGGQYFMYYSAKTTGNRDAIYYATSTDLQNWEVQDTVLVGPSDTADREYVMGGPRVVVTQTGQYRMYYRCCPRHEPWQEPEYHIRSAISSDGINFTREGVRIEIQPHDPNSRFRHVGHSAFFRSAGGMVAALLTVKDTTMGPQMPDQIYQAVSMDDGLTFSGFTPKYWACHDPVVVMDSMGEYRAFFSYLDQGFRHVSSPNGLNWPATPDTLRLMQGSTELLESTYPGIADLGAAIAPTGQTYLYSNYHTAMGLWTDIAFFEEVIATGLDNELGSKLFTVFPNPMEQWTQMEMGEGKTGYLEVWDVLGKVWFEGKGEGGWRIETSVWPSGIYIAKVTDEVGNREIVRMMKR